MFNSPFYGWLAVFESPSQGQRAVQEFFEVRCHGSTWGELPKSPAKMKDFKKHDMIGWLMYYISFYLYLYRYHSNKLVSTQVHIPAWLSKKRCDFDQHEGVKESTWWCEQQKWGVNPCGIHSGINFFPSDFLLVSNWIPIWTKRETDATDVFFGNFLVEQELEPWLVRQRGLRKGVQFVTDVLAHGRQEQTQILGTTRLGFPQALKKYLGLWVHT